MTTKVPVSMIEGLTTSTPVTTTIANFSLNNSTPNQRVNFNAVDAGGYNTGTGTLSIMFDMLPTNYFANCPTSHTAVVLRSDPALDGIAVRGQGFVFGKFTALGIDHFPTSTLESWQNGIPPRDNFVWKTTTLPQDALLTDGTTYRVLVESIVNQTGNRELRYAIWKYNSSDNQYYLMLDTGNVADTNTYFDSTKTGITFGYVLADNLGAWSISFTNVKVTWSNESEYPYYAAGSVLSVPTSTEVAPGNIPKFGDLGSGIGFLTVPPDGRFMISKPISAPSDYATMQVHKSTESTTGGKSTVGQNVVFSTTTGVNSQTTEYNVLCLLHNYTPLYTDGTGPLAAGPQNVGLAYHAYNHSTAATWASWAVISDANPNPTVGQIGLEMGCEGYGNDIYYNRNAIHFAVVKNEAAADAEWGRIFYISCGTSVRIRRIMEVHSSTKIVDSVLYYQGTPAAGAGDTAIIRSVGETSIGIDFDSATFDSGVAIKLAYGQKITFGSGYSSWGTATNTLAGGSYDASLSGWPNDNATLFGLIRTLYQSFGHLQNELKTKGVLQ